MSWSFICGRCNVEKASCGKVDILHERVEALNVDLILTFDFDFLGPLLIFEDVSVTD